MTKVASPGVEAGEAFGPEQPKDPSTSKGRIWVHISPLSKIFHVEHDQRMSQDC